MDAGLIKMPKAGIYLEYFAVANRSEILELRRHATELLSEPAYRYQVEPQLLAPRAVGLAPPLQIRDYTDFYASIHHAINVGRLFRPDSPLLPNYKYVPIGYHGRAPSTAFGGTEVPRPWGQTKAPDALEPTFTPSRMLDYELEMGFFVGAGNELGSTIPISE